MKKKRIFLYHMSGKGGGSDHSLYNLVKHLNKERFEVFVYVKRSSSFDDQITASGAHIIKSGGEPINSSKTDNNNSFTKLKKKSQSLRRTRLFYYIYTTPKLIIKSIPEAVKVYKILKKYQIEIIHLNHSLSSDRSALIAGLLANVRIISHYRGLVEPEKIDVLLSRFVDKIICISEFVKQEYISYGIDRNKCIVIHNGVDTTVFKPCTKKEKENLIIANIGRLETWKGQHVFLEAAAKLIEEYNNLKFWIIGSGSQKSRLIELSKNLKIEEYVEFKGYVKNISEILPEIDVLIHTSIEPEPFGRVIIEGMASGLPVIATDVGGPKEIINNECDGLLVAPNDAIDLKAKLELLFNNKEKMISIGEAAKNRISNEFDIVDNTLQIEKIYAS